MPKRRLDNWLHGLANYVEDTESPRNFWLWSGLFSIASALQRKVWLPFGLDNIYPNLFVLIVAPPAKCRKGGPPGLAKKMLEGLSLAVSADSSSKRALTQTIEEVSKDQRFFFNNKPINMASLAVISKEMSSLLAVDPKGMIEVLTDLFDSHDNWLYKTSGQGSDSIQGVCVSTFIATTPTWLSANLPQEAIGGGFTSRFAIVTGYEKYKQVPIPTIPDRRIYEALIHDLNIITTLVGEFRWEEEAREYFIAWYNTLDDVLEATEDDRLHGFIGRMHVIALKVAMALHVATSDDLIINVGDIGKAIHLLEEVLKAAPDALGGHGLSRLGPITDKIKNQIKQKRKISVKGLMSINYRDVDAIELNNILNSLHTMGYIREITNQDGESWWYYNVEGGG